MDCIKFFKKTTIFTVLLFIVSTSLVVAIDTRDNNIIKSNSNDNMKIAITFDDGPHPKETDKILEVLEKYNAKATFFVVGKHVNWYTSSVVRASKAGHEIGNHTYTHPDISTLSKQQIKDEIKKCEDIIVQKTGKKPTLFRPPFGNYDENTLNQISKEMGYKIILWSGVDAKDWKNPNPNQIADKIIDSVKSGDIILLHDYGTENTVKALDIILFSLTKTGYKFVTVSELLDDNKI